MSNLILNPGFETWTGGTTFTFNSGTPNGNIADHYTASLETFLNPNLSAIISKDTVIFDTGLASCKIVLTDTNSTSTGANCIIVQNYITTGLSGNVVNFSCRVKIDGSSLNNIQQVQVQPTVFNGHTQLAVGNAISVQSTDWVTISGTMPYSTTGTQQVFIHLIVTPFFAGFGTGTTATIWFDTLDYEVVTAQPIVVNLTDSLLSQDWVTPNRMNDVTFGD